MYTASTTAMLIRPSTTDTRHFPTNSPRRERPYASAFLSVPFARSSPNSTHTSSPAMRNSSPIIEMRLLSEKRTVA